MNTYPSYANKMSNKLNKLTSSDAVVAAIAECDAMGREKFLSVYGYKHSRLYLLHYDGRVYDSKAIAGVAFGKQHGTPLKASEFSGGEATVVPCLQQLGFTVGKAAHPATQLIVGKTYFRKDLVVLFGGQLQAGIWTPREFPVIFIFSGDSGKAYGYSDGWTVDGVFRYTGEGQDGNMEFTSGNKAIRDHRKNGEDILLFEDLGKGNGVRYTGIFECASWSYIDAFDKEKKIRKAIVFDLVPVSSAAELQDIELEVKRMPNESSIDQLRDAAYQASIGEQSESRSGDSKRSWYERSNKVRDYVLARAAGICEACGNSAPFMKRDGRPYLEPHHTKRLADEGPDHPAWVGAICPNCHRRIHSGNDGDEWNRKLQQHLGELENHFEY